MLCTAAAVAWLLSATPLAEEPSSLVPEDFDFNAPYDEEPSEPLDPPESVACPADQYLVDGLCTQCPRGTVKAPSADEEAAKPCEKATWVRWATRGADAAVDTALFSSVLAAGIAGGGQIVREVTPTFFCTYDSSAGDFARTPSSSADPAVCRAFRGTTQLAAPRCRFAACTYVLWAEAVTDQPYGVCSFVDRDVDWSAIGLPSAEIQSCESSEAGDLAPGLHIVDAVACDPVQNRADWVDPVSVGSCVEMPSGAGYYIVTLCSRKDAISYRAYCDEDCAVCGVAVEEPETIGESCQQNTGGSADRSTTFAGTCPKDSSVYHVSVRPQPSAGLEPAAAVLAAVFPRLLAPLVYLPSEQIAVLTARNATKSDPRAALSFQFLQVQDAAGATERLRAMVEDPASDFNYLLDSTGELAVSEVLEPPPVPPAPQTDTEVPMWAPVLVGVLGFIAACLIVAVVFALRPTAEDKTDSMRKSTTSSSYRTIAV